jgi:hypothetical protein
LLLADRPNDVTGVGHRVGYDSPSQFVDTGDWRIAVDVSTAQPPDPSRPRIVGAWPAGAD